VVASEGACVLLVPRGDYRVVLRGTCAYDGHPVELDARWVRQVSLWRPGRFEVSFDLRGFAPTLDVRLEGSAGQVAYVELAGTSLSARVTLPGRWLVCAPAGVATVRVISERETREFKRTIDPGELAVEEIELAAVARRSRSTEVATPEVAPAARSASTPPAIELALDQSALPGPSPTLAGIGAPAATLLELTPPRQVLAGRYQLGERLGAGAAGVVYRGEDLRLEREIAVKVLGGAHRDDPAAMRQLADEARTLARLSHPGIVAVYDCVVSRAERCLVMEFVDGDSLEAMLARRGPMPIRPVLRIGIALAEALAYAHRHGVLHRDIKPANVLVGRSGAIKLGDFGIARVTADLLIAQTGVRGTPAYMAPEQVRGRDVDARSDIYGLGATLFAAACGAPPFVDGMVGFRKLHEPAPAPSSVVPSLPDGFDALIARCLALEPRDRFASAGELLDALRRLAAAITDELPSGPLVWAAR
jgi:predicted Ser/Thr protein kinase